MVRGPGAAQRGRALGPSTRQGSGCPVAVEEVDFSFLLVHPRSVPRTSAAVVAR